MPEWEALGFWRDARPRGVGRGGRQGRHVRRRRWSGRSTTRTRATRSCSRPGRIGWKARSRAPGGGTCTAASTIGADRSWTPGAQQITFKPDGKFKTALMDLRELRLTPRAADGTVSETQAVQGSWRREHHGRLMDCLPFARGLHRHHWRREQRPRGGLAAGLFCRRSYAAPFFRSGWCCRCSDSATAALRHAPADEVDALAEARVLARRLSRSPCWRSSGRTAASRCTARSCSCGRPRRACSSRSSGRRRRRRTSAAGASSGGPSRCSRPGRSRRRRSPRRSSSSFRSLARHEPRRLGAGDQHRADDEVGLQQVLADRVRVADRSCARWPASRRRGSAGGRG